MKKFPVVLLVMICGMTNCFGQQFSFQLTFTDAIGNKDTITLGYDAAATTGIDASFGEVDVIAVPLDTGLDVRITNYWMDSSSPIYFHTKKQIVFYDCTYTNWSIQSINIFTHHWPVTVEWDTTLFNDTCRKGTVFTSVHPGGWWDTGSPSDLGMGAFFYSSSPTTFTSNFQLGLFGYINNSGDSIPVFWQAFGDIGLLSSSVQEHRSDKTGIKLFPNPSGGEFTIESNQGAGGIIVVYNMLGEKVYETTLTSAHQILNPKLAPGIYFLQVSDGEKMFTQKLAIE